MKGLLWMLCVIHLNIVPLYCLDFSSFITKLMLFCFLLLFNHYLVYIVNMCPNIKLVVVLLITKCKFIIMAFAGGLSLFLSSELEFRYWVTFIDVAKVVTWGQGLLYAKTSVHGFICLLLSFRDACVWPFVFYIPSHSTFSLLYTL